MLRVVTILFLPLAPHVLSYALVSLGISTHIFIPLHGCPPTVYYFGLPSPLSLAPCEHDIMLFSCMSVDCGFQQMNSANSNFENGRRYRIEDSKAIIPLILLNGMLQYILYFYNENLKAEYFVNKRDLFMWEFWRYKRVWLQNLFSITKVIMEMTTNGRSTCKRKLKWGDISKRPMRVQIYYLRICF